MPVPATLKPVWQDFATSLGGVGEAPAHELGELVLRGTKRATTASAWSFEAQGKRLPAPGDLSIVSDWAGRPLCLIETLAVDILPFGEVGAEFAAAEGEGLLSYWKAAHRQYFGRECVRAGRAFSEDVPVACERFRGVIAALGAR